MARLAIGLLALAIVCALAVITSQHRARGLFSELEGAQATAKKLNEEWSQLQLEQSTWATNRRVESVASRRLGMRLADPATTVVITLERP
jgi:cell division protein FtsL